MSETPNEMFDLETPQSNKISIDPEINDDTTFRNFEVQPQQTETVHMDLNVELPQWNKCEKPSLGQNHTVDILKKSATLMDEKYKERSLSHGSKCLVDLDDMGLFFLSMSSMTKNLPKLEQARIKLEFSIIGRTETSRLKLGIHI